MRFWLYLLVGVLAIMLLGYLLSAVVGLIVWAAVVAGIGALLVGFVRHGVLGSDDSSAPGKRAVRRAEKSADRALKELEKKDRQ